MGLPDLMVVHVGHGPKTTLDMARLKSAMDKEKSRVSLRFNILIKYHSQIEKTIVARSYSDCHFFLFWEWYFIDILNVSSHT